MTRLKNLHWFLFWLLWFFTPITAIAIALGVQYGLYYPSILFLTYVGVVYWDVYFRRGEYYIDTSVFSVLWHDIKTKRKGQ